MLAFATFICGCSQENGPTGAIELASNQKDVVEIPAEGGEVAIRFTSALDWHLEVSDNWLQVSPEQGQPGMARVDVSALLNETDAERTAVINICSGNLKVPVTVTQGSFIPTFELLSTSQEISCEGGTFVIKLRTDVEYTCKCDKTWVREIKTKAVEEKQHTFSVDPNTEAESRTAYVSFCTETMCYTFTLTQRPAGTSADDWKYDPFRRHSLAMRFTADWCVNCPMMANAFDLAKEELEGQLEFINVHGGGSSLESEGLSQLQRRFRVSGFPTGIIDSRASIPNNVPEVTASNAVLAARETASAYPSKTGIAFDSSISGSKLTLDLKLYVKEADIYKVTAILLEDGIKCSQAGADDPDNYIHNNTARMALTSVEGDVVRVDEDNSIWQKAYTMTIPSGYDKDNLRILVYVEKPYGSQPRVEEVAAAKYGDYGDLYVDNCRSAKVGEAVQLELN